MPTKKNIPGRKLSVPKPTKDELTIEVKGKRPTISLCMIVKDEEERLPTALNSAAPWVDEIVVVDTGSSDNTVSIAESFGARIYHHPWEHDFSKARNQSLSYASCDWVMILDADEELDQETAPLLHKAVYSPDVNCFLFKLVNYLETGGTSFLAHARLFRNHIGFHYEGAVHNRPIGSGKMVSIPVLLHHYGYNLSKEAMEAKQQRRIDMIGKWVENEPDNPFAHAYLSTTLVVEPTQRVRAVDEALTSLRLMKEQNLEKEQYPRAYWPLISALNVIGRYDDALKYSFECLEHVPYYPDPLFQIAVAYYKKGDWNQVVEHTQRFLELQAEAKENPNKFVLFENMTVGQIRYALMRHCLSLLHLGRYGEAQEAFDAILQEEEAESSATITLQEAMFIAPEPTVRMAEAALAAHPEWSGVEKILTAARGKYEQEAKANLRQDGLAAVERGDFTQAADLLSQGARINPTDAETLLGLGKALLEKGERQEAIPLLFKGLNAHPGHHWAYMVLAEDELAAGNYQGAAALLQRLQSLSPNRPEIVKRLEVCQRRLREQPPLPSVAQKPPKLLIFLVGGLTPKMVQAAAPHFLMGHAWGELLGGYNPEARDLPGWGSIYTGRPPVEHGIEQDFINGRMACLDDLKLTSLWDLLARDLRLGLMSIPLGCPPPKQAAWSVAGFPGGLLDRSLVHPPELTPLVLSEGYRTDLLLTENDQQGYCIQLEKDFRQEALLYQTERHRLGTAMAMPAVDVLAIGFNLLERVQHCFGLEPSMYRTGAFQQLYAILETTLSALLPENFAIIGQRSYESEAGELTPEGFYCLSWLKGENGKARAETLAPEILKLMGVNPAPLGKPLS